MTQAKRRQLTRELDTRVCHLRLTGLDGTALFAVMADHMPDFKALLDTAGPSGMDALAGRLPDLRRYAELLTARGIQDGTIKCRGSCWQSASWEAHTMAQARQRQRAAPALT